jgi:ABC-type branched-subunit amino acid transport system substrate-binding protein
MAVSIRAALIEVISVAILFVSGCAVSHSQSPVKIALFAPFEGRYREVGYEMLYAARLAIAEAGADASQIELLPIDDGGNPANARNRAAAIALNPDVRIVITAGFTATDPDVLAAFSGLPVMIVGRWNPPPQQTRENTFILASGDDASSSLESDLQFVAFAQQADAVSGGELLSLDQFRLLRNDLTTVTVRSSAVLPSPDFSARYHASDPFAPEPRLLSTLTYDATRIAMQVVNPTGTRQDMKNQLQVIEYEGINGVIRFDTDGYWQDAPLHRYQYNADGQLVEITDQAIP